MRHLTLVLGVCLGFLCLLAPRASAQQVTGSYVVTNMGKDVGEQASVRYYPAGNHDSATAEAYSSGQVTLPPGNYDIDINFGVGAVQKEIWLNNQAISGNFAKTVELNVGIAQAAVTVTNGGKDVGEQASVHYYPTGDQGSATAAVYSAGQVTLPPGNYDIDISFADGAVQKEVWLNGQAISGNFAKTVELNIGIAQAAVTVTNGGQDVGEQASVHYYPAGNHGSSTADNYSAGQVTLPPGNYDIDINFSVGAVQKEVWLNNQAISGNFTKTVELNAGIAQADVTVTNGGKDVGEQASVHYYPAGNHASSTAVNYSAGQVTLPPGNYDIDINFSNGSVNKEIWLNNQGISGNFTKTVELNAGIAQAEVTVTNGGKDVGEQASVHYYPAGNHASSTADNYSAGQVTLPPGNYDIDINFNNGSVNKEVWLNNQVISGNFTKTVELNAGIAQAEVTVTNGGKDVGEEASLHYYPAGNHASPTAVNYSAGQVTLPPGDYDIDISFGVGDVHKEIWLDNQAISGNFTKTVELGLAIANVSYSVTNGGQDTGEATGVDFYPSGQYDDATSSGFSGTTHEMLEGSYDIHVSYANALARKEVWLYNQQLSGTVTKTVELGLALAMPTVNVTIDGGKPAMPSVVSYYDEAGDDLGDVAGGQPTVINAGTYDIQARFGDAAGWLRGKSLPAGAETLTIDLSSKAPEAAPQAAAASPAPAPSHLVVSACTIEAYGVNFDFDKAILRPEATETLQQILALFSKNPGFTGEIGGHTDNIGPRPYNMKLSAARAEAVKAWLVAQGVAADRMTTAGYADTRPLVPNDSDADRFKNRRVEIKRDSCG